MKCSKVMESLEKLAPRHLACDWDNVGLLTGSAKKDVKCIYIALDATEEVINHAIRKQADMLITHHPLVFRPLYQLNCENFISSRIIKLIQQDIAYYAMHTNFDIASGGMADLAADRLKLTNTLPLEVTQVMEGGSLGIGKVGYLEEIIVLEELADIIKTLFGIGHVTVFGELKKPIKKVAISPGSGKDLINPALLSGAEVLITGDIDHHHGIDANAQGLAIIDGGHYGLEHIFIDFVKQYLERQFQDECTIIAEPIRFPYQIL